MVRGGNGRLISLGCVLVLRVSSLLARRRSCHSGVELVYTFFTFLEPIVSYICAVLKLAARGICVFCSPKIHVMPIDVAFVLEACRIFDACCVRDGGFVGAWKSGEDDAPVCVVLCVS